jgi:hypothetical protein
MARSRDVPVPPAVEAAVHQAEAQVAAAEAATAFLETRLHVTDAAIASLRGKCAELGIELTTPPASAPEPAQSEPPVALKIDAFAKRWSISPRSVRYRIQQGLPVVGSGRSMRVPVEEGDLWMRDHGEEPVVARAKSAARRAARRDKR